MNLVPLAEHLERSGVGTVGQSIFVYTFPANVTEGVLLRPPLIGAKIDHDLPGYMKFDFQVIARANNYASAEALATAAINALHMEGDSGSVAGWTVNYIRPDHVPVGFPVSIGDFVEFNTRMSVCAVVPAWAFR